MKIAVVTSFPRDPAAPHGGVEAVSVNLVKALARLPNTELHVVTTDGNVGCLEKTVWENATIHRLPAAGQNLLVYATGEGRRQVQHYLEQLNPDVIHAHDTYGIMVKGMKSPRVFTVHGFIHEDTRYGGERMAWLRAALWKRVETASWREQPHIVSISPYVRERLRGIARGTIHDIENPIAEECFDVVHQGRDRSVVFCAASICERKNTLGLLNAFGQLLENGVEAELRLAGMVTDQGYGRAVKEFIRDRGLESAVTLIGSVSAARVREELASASVFALVSFEEGAPMGIAEAMAAGVPIVTSNLCGMPYMVRHGETGFLVDPHRPQDVARKLETILREPALAENMGRNAREFAMARFHPDKIASRTLAVYCEAVN